MAFLLSACIGKEDPNRWKPGSGLVEPGYRLLANTGPDSHQEVPHLHVHIFAGRPLGPMLAR